MALATPKSWVRFPGKARADKNVETVTWMQCKSLWIKASAKCINVNVNVNLGEVLAYWVVSQTCNPNVVGSSLRSGRDCLGGVINQLSLHPQYHDWGETLEQGTESPTAPRTLQHKWLSTSPGVNSQYVRVCVYMFTTHCCVWMHLDGLSQRFSIPVLAPPRLAHFVCFSYRFRRLFYLNISALRSGQMEGARTGIENRWVKCREQIPSIGHHAWPHVTSFPFLVIFFLKISSQCICTSVEQFSPVHIGKAHNRVILKHQEI